MNDLHESFQCLDLESYLQTGELTKKKDDLSIKSAALAQLVKNNNLAESQLSECLNDLAQISLGSQESLLPSLAPWIDQTYSLEIVISLTRGFLDESTKYLGQCLSSDAIDYSCLDPLGQSIELSLIHI